jgi:hypothetical protein
MMETIVEAGLERQWLQRRVLLGDLTEGVELGTILHETSVRPFSSQCETW